MPANRFGFSRTWTGGDGKYETVNSVKRSKWNNYTFTRALKQTGPSIAFKGQYKLSSTSPWEAFNVPVTQTLPPAGSGISWTAADELALLSKLLKKTKGHSFNLAVSSAEAGKTIDLVTGTLRTLTRSFLALKHGDFASAARWLGANPPDVKHTRVLKTQDLASRWLEMQYGWRPLVNDVYEGFKAYHAITSKPRVTTVRASNFKATSTQSSDSPDTYSANGTRKYTKTIIYEASEDLSVPRQIGLTNPLSVAWELLPYSFVVDWFIPIGTYLDVLSQLPLLKGRFMTTTVDEWRGYTYRWSPTSNWPAPVGSPLRPTVVLNPNSVPSVQGLWMQMTRTVSSSLGVPLPISFDKGGLNGRRVWNAIALAHTAFIGRKSAVKVAEDLHLIKRVGD